MSAAGADSGLSPRDPGAQPERTRLAWRRTTLSFAVCVGLTVRKALTDGSTAGALAAVLGLVAWLGFLAVAHRRIANMAAARPHEMPGRLVQGAVLCTLAMTIVGAVMLW